MTLSRVLNKLRMNNFLVFPFNQDLELNYFKNFITNNKLT